jgi:hypothetical protein
MADKIIEIEGVGPLAFPAEMSNEEIQAVLDREFGPRSRRPPTLGEQVLNSPIGGIIRGLRDPLDAGAQLLSRGAESLAQTIAPGSSVAEALTRERQNVEAVNQAAEAEYRQNWRRGEMNDEIDVGRLIGNVGASLPAAAIAPIRGGMSLLQAGGRGAVQGAVAAPLTQPVYNTEDADFYSQKAGQTAMGAVFGAGGGAGGQFVGNVMQGGQRAGTSAVAGGGRQSASASTNVNVNPQARVTGGGATPGTVGPDPSSALTTSQSRVAQRGRELGFRNTPGQVSGSRALQQMEARLESSPLTSGPFNTIKNQNQSTLNRVVAGSIGEQAEVVDSAVLNAAENRLSGIFENVTDSVPKAVIGDDIVGGLSAIEREAADILEKPLLENKLVEKVFNIAAKGEATGAELRSLSTKLGVAAKYQMTSPNGDRMLGESLFQVKDMVDEIVSQNLDDATRETFNAARSQYRNLMTLLSRTNIVNPSSGNVSGANLAGALMQRDRGGFTLGRNQSDLYDAARFSQAFRPIVGDSGTATRMMQPGVTDMILSLPTNIATRAYVSQPVQSLATASQRGLAPNAYGDAVAQALRRSGPAAGVGTGFQGLLSEPGTPLRIDIEGVGRRR